MTINKKSMMKSSTVLACCMLAVAVSAGAFGLVIPARSAIADGDSNVTNGTMCPHVVTADDSRIAMELETAYRFNKTLKTMPIETDVRDGTVILAGRVASAIDSDLAAEMARSIDGVEEVENLLEVREGLEPVEMPQIETDLLQKMKDASTTVQVKTRLVGNAHIAARNINVDTENDIVRLSGEVHSDSEKLLAEYIARNTFGVHTVFNTLEIRHSG
jgi:osmotically-inducible protein OsmY